MKNTKTAPQVEQKNVRSAIRVVAIKTGVKAGGKPHVF